MTPFGIADPTLGTPGVTFRALALRQRETENKNNYFLFLSDERPMLETLDYTIRIGSTPTILYFDLYLYSTYAAHYVNFTGNFYRTR